MELDVRSHRIPYAGCMGLDDQTSAGAPLIVVHDDDVKALSVCTKPKIGSSDTDDRITRHFM